MNFINVSRYGHGRIDLVPDFCDDVLYDVPPIQLNEIIWANSDYSFVSRIFILA